MKKITFFISEYVSFRLIFLRQIIKLCYLNSNNYISNILLLCWLPFLLYIPRLLKHRSHLLKEFHHCLSLQISSLKYQLYIFCI